MIIRLLSVATLAFAVIAAPAEAAKRDKKARKGGRDGANIGRLLSRFDTDKNGTINGEEVARVQALFASFAAIDTDKNGQLSESELATVKVPEARARAGKGGKRGAKGATTTTPSTSTTPSTGTTTPKP